jgi:DNA-binding CsgD family transcriptional regulator
MSTSRKMSTRAKRPRASNRLTHVPISVFSIVEVCRVLQAQKLSLAAIAKILGISINTLRTARKNAQK